MSARQISDVTSNFAFPVPKTVATREAPWLEAEGASTQVWLHQTRLRDGRRATSTAANTK
ncbi:hypothetical protein E2C01_072073 [Portunus trituberculatus]|uniref:Uncharacterized protein n=1 Tax=Portunus trituberculatus TaxID=210409 RepID=A0A5B7I681_PORTR|nr:hypothetical protein [Portunus trituberculatus]